jgi:hypothetical protein
LSTDSTGCQLLPTTQPAACRLHVWQQLATRGLGGNRQNQLIAVGISYQLILPIVNRFPRSPTAANRAAGMLPAARLAAIGKTGAIGWQAVESVCSRWNQLAAVKCYMSTKFSWY